MIVLVSFEYVATISLLLVNPVGMGSNQFVGDQIEIGEVIISEDGISYTTNMSHIKHTDKTRGLLIYEG